MDEGGAFPPLPCAEYLERIDLWYEQNLDKAAVRSGVRGALDAFEGKGVRQAVVSNGRKRSVLAMLAAHGLTPYFEVILGKEDYEGRKPDPAPYLTALARMNVRPEEGLAIEDEDVGVIAARSAGIPVIHRRFRAQDVPAPGALSSPFSEEEFRESLKPFLQE